MRIIIIIIIIIVIVIIIIIYYVFLHVVQMFIFHAVYNVHVVKTLTTLELSHCVIHEQIGRYFT